MERDNIMSNEICMEQVISEFPEFWLEGSRFSEDYECWDDLYITFHTKIDDYIIEHTTYSNWEEYFIIYEKFERDKIRIRS